MPIAAATSRAVCRTGRFRRLSNSASLVVLCKPPLTPAPALTRFAARCLARASRRRVASCCRCSFAAARRCLLSSQRRRRSWASAFSGSRTTECSRRRRKSSPSICVRSCASCGGSAGRPRSAGQKPCNRIRSRIVRSSAFWTISLYNFAFSSSAMSLFLSDLAQHFLRPCPHVRVHMLLCCLAQQALQHRLVFLIEEQVARPLDNDRQPVAEHRNERLDDRLARISRQRSRGGPAQAVVGRAQERAQGVEDFGGNRLLPVARIADPVDRRSGPFAVLTLRLRED